VLTGYSSKSPKVAMTSTDIDLNVKALRNAAFCKSAGRATCNRLERAALVTLTEMWKALASERYLSTEADFFEQFELLAAAQRKIVGLERQLGPVFS
jgi:hypothetical protein